MVKHQGNVVSTAQAVTATAVSTQSINLQAARDLGNGSNIQANFTVQTSVTAAGAATVTFEIISADDELLTSNVTVLAASRPYTKDELTITGLVGNQQSLAVSLMIPTNLSARPLSGAAPPHIPRMRQYLGVRYTVATGPLTAGTFNAWFGPNHVGDARKFYPAGW